MDIETLKKIPGVSVLESSGKSIKFSILGSILEGGSLKTFPVEIFSLIFRGKILLGNAQISSSEPALPKCWAADRIEETLARMIRSRNSAEQAKNTPPPEEEGVEELAKRVSRQFLKEHGSDSLPLFMSTMADAFLSAQNHNNNGTDRQSDEAPDSGTESEDRGGARESDGAGAVAGPVD